MSVMLAKYGGRCLRCQGRIQAGERIDWLGKGRATHVECPSPQQQLATGGGREARWWRPKPKLEPKVWAVRVTDPAGGCHELAGQEVEITSGRTAGKKVTLGERLGGATQRDSTYAVVSEVLPDEEALPAGRYALEEPGQRYMLVRVWRKNGRVNVFDAKTRQKVPDVKAMMDRIIAAGPGEAAILYGKVTGECSRCGEQLSVRLSIELGIGPVCMKHWYGSEDRKAMKAAARARLRSQGLDPSEQVVIDTAQAA